MTFFALLVSLVLLQIKHYLADFHWQTAWMLQHKAHYGQIGGIVHALLHAGLSIPALCVAAGGWDSLLIVIVIAELVLHYHIDWVTLKVRDRSDASAADQAFWRTVGIDQLAHQLTYIGMVAAVILYV